MDLDYFVSGLVIFSTNNDYDGICGDFRLV